MPNEILSKPSPALSPQMDMSIPEPKNKKVEISVISLPGATERRRKIEEMFRGTGLKWSYFDAHTSLKYPALRYDADEITRRFGRILSRSEIGIFSSHAGVLRDFLDRGEADYILVLEDDVIFDTDFPLDNFSTFCAENGMDYVRLFSKHYAPAVKLGFYFDRMIVRFKTTPAGAQAYLMSKVGVRKFLDSYQSIDAALDLAMDKFWTTQLPIYSIFPYPIIERFSPSSNPMPPPEGGSQGWLRIVSIFYRAIAKTQKIRANIALRPSDRAMQQKPWYFQQIFDANGASK